MKIEKWIEKNINIKKFTNKTVMITGGNSGIGFELAKHLVKLGAKVILLCRNEDKAKKAIEELKHIKEGSNIEFIKLDLASLDSIKNSVSLIKEYDIDMFINNAGVFKLPNSYTKDGLEMVMGTNYIGTLYLNSLLLPYLNKLNHPVHIVFESSLTSMFSKIDYSDFFMSKNYKDMSIYGRSKLAINNMYYYFIKKYSNNPNLILSLTHPGATYTPLIGKWLKHQPIKAITKFLMGLVFHSPNKASLTILYALNKDKNVMVGPKGFIEISGFPKETIFKFEKQYLECINIGFKIISNLEK